MTKTTIRHTYKDSLFRMIFREKKELLSLYNALNGTAHENEEDLEINTLEDVIYMGFKNDTSFLLDTYVNLYEAQSTWNPNMPLRGIIYFSKLYQEYLTERDLDLYSEVQLKIPTPKFVVFYNGSTKKPERSILKLSDAFIRKDEESALECVATVININDGYNKKLMENCHKLYEYAVLIRKIREGLKQGLNLGAAVDRAIKECIAEGILADFLKKHRAGVKDVILTEYNEELHIRNEKELSFRQGEAQGLSQGISKGEQLTLIKIVCKKLQKGKTLESIAEELEEDISDIQKIILVAEKCAPEYDVEKIYELLKDPE